MADQIQLPSGSGGLMKYSDTSGSRIKLKPGTVVFLIILIMIAEFFLHRLGGA